MADVFQPQVAQINSAVTPKQGVADTSAVELFSDVAQAATSAAFSFTGQRELTDLSNKFSRVVQAREAGGSSSALQVKARADLDAAKASSPWIAKQADKLFADTFGGSTFEDTPQEKARKKHLQRVEETRLALGLSTEEEAQKRISLDENAKSAKVQADAQKDVRQYNGEVVFSNTQAQLNNNSIKFMDAMNRTMTLSGGTLSNDAVRDLNLTVDQTSLQLKQQLNSQTRDPNTGHLLIDKAGYDANLKEIEDWVTNTKAMVGDSAYMKVIQDLNTEQSAEINFVATAKYRTLKELDAAGGQAAVGAYIVAAQRPEGAAKQLLIGANPIAKDMFKQKGSFNQASSDGLDKIVVSTPSTAIMSEPEALATGTVLNDPANSKLVDTTVDKVATEPSSVEPYKSMIKKNPDSSAIMWSERFKAWKTQNPAKAETVLGHSMDALKNSFLSSYVSDTGKLPRDFTISDVVETETRQTKGGSKQVRSSKRGRFKRNVVKGEGITEETGKILSNMLSVLTNNPDYAKQVANELNLVDETTPQELVRAIVFGVELTPDDIAFQENEAREKQSKGSAKESDTKAPTKQLDEATASPDALKLQPFLDQGVSKEQMLNVLDSIGFADNAEKKRMISIVDEAYD